MRALDLAPFAFAVALVAGGARGGAAARYQGSYLMTTIRRSGEPAPRRTSAAACKTWLQPQRIGSVRACLRMDRDAVGGGQPVAAAMPAPALM